MFNVERQLIENIGAKIIEVEIKYNSVISHALVCEVKDTADVNEVIKFISDTLVIDQAIKTGKLKKGGLNEILFGKVFNTPPTYAFVSGNYLILSENKETNDYYINSAVNNAMVTQNETFMTYAKDNLNSPFNYQYHSSPNNKPSVITKEFAFVK